MTLQECLFLSPQLVLVDPCHLSCLLQFRFKQAELVTELTKRTDIDRIRRLCIVDTFRIVRSATTKILALTSTPSKALHLGLIHITNTEAVQNRLCRWPLTYIHSLVYYSLRLHNDVLRARVPYCLMLVICDVHI